MADGCARDRVQLLPGPAGVAGADPRIAALVEEADAELLLAGAQLLLRRRQLDEVRRVVENRYSREEALRRVLASAPWLWGGDFVDVAATRRLVRGKEIDVALVRPGGVLHAVELKRANVRLVKAHRGELVLTSEVHDAVGQMANYLRVFDERRREVLEDHGVDVRRGHGTVVIGHPMFQPDVPAEAIDETLRSYLSHVSRIDVVTYGQLIEGAERWLDVAASLGTSGG